MDHIWDGDIHLKALDPIQYAEILNHQNIRHFHILDTKDAKFAEAWEKCLVQGEALTHSSNSRTFMKIWPFPPSKLFHGMLFPCLNPPHGQKLCHGRHKFQFYEKLFCENTQIDVYTCHSSRCLIHEATKGKVSDCESLAHERWVLRIVSFLKPDTRVKEYHSSRCDISLYHFLSLETLSCTVSTPVEISQTRTQPFNYPNSFKTSRLSEDGHCMHFSLQNVNLLVFLSGLALGQSWEGCPDYKDIPLVESHPLTIQRCDDSRIYRLRSQVQKYSEKMNDIHKSTHSEVNWKLSKCRRILIEDAIHLDDGNEGVNSSKEEMYIWEFTGAPRSSGSSAQDSSAYKNGRYHKNPRICFTPWRMKKRNIDQMSNSDQIAYISKFMIGPGRLDDTIDETLSSSSKCFKKTISPYAGEEYLFYYQANLLESERVVKPTRAVLCSEDQKLRDALRRTQLAQGLSQRKVANEIGISSASLSLFLNNKIRPSDEMLTRLLLWLEA